MVGAAIAADVSQCAVSLFDVLSALPIDVVLKHLEMAPPRSVSIHNLKVSCRAGRLLAYELTSAFMFDSDDLGPADPLDHVRRLPNLREVGVRMSPILAARSLAPFLTAVAVASVPVTGPLMSSRVTVLKIDGHVPKDIDLWSVIISGYPSLQHLSCSGWESGLKASRVIRDDGEDGTLLRSGAPLSTLTALRSLDLRALHIDAYESIGLLTGLTSLTIRMWSIPPAVLASWHSLSRLTSCTILLQVVTSMGDISDLFALAQLTSLRLTRAVAHEPALVRLAGLTGLASLDLGLECRLDATQVGLLGHLHLTHLGLDCISGSTVSGMFPRLRSLSTRFNMKPTLLRGTLAALEPLLDLEVINGQTGLLRFWWETEEEGPEQAALGQVAHFLSQAPMLCVHDVRVPGCPVSAATRRSLRPLLGCECNRGMLISAHRR